jgi:hypothetical protein
MTCSKHDFTNGHVRSMVKQETIEINAKFEMLKLDLLSLTYANILSSKPKQSSTPLPWFATVALVMLCISKIPIITRVGFDEVLMKLTTIAKVSKLTQNIQSQMNMYNIQDSSVRMTHFSLVVSTTSRNISITI